MPGLFLTTAALRIYLLWPDSPLSRRIEERRMECWISPLSHAILKDTCLSEEDVDVFVRKKMHKEVLKHERVMQEHMR